MLLFSCLADVIANSQGQCTNGSHICISAVSVYVSLVPKGPRAQRTHLVPEVLALCDLTQHAAVLLQLCDVMQQLLLKLGD